MSEKNMFDLTTADLEKMDSAKIQSMLEKLGKSIHEAEGIDISREEVMTVNGVTIEVSTKKSRKRTKKKRANFGSTIDPDF